MKRGASQVEVIIAFVLFAGFVLFALYFFSPLKSDRLYDSSLDYALREIVKNTSVEIDQRSLAINPEIIDPIVAIKISSFDKEGSKFRVLKENEEEVDFWLNGNDIVFDRAGQRFFFVQFSEEFPDALTSGQAGIQLAGNSFSLGTSSIKKVISEKKFLELNQTYYTNYDGLREQFNLPGRIDFAFGLYLEDRKIESTREIPDSINVAASNTREEILDINGKLSFGELAVRVW